MSLPVWIFQAVPKHFDFDAFLASGHEECLWRVSRHGAKMQPGQTLFLWRGKRGDRTGLLAGVVAQAVIIDEPAIRSDTSSAASFWINPADRTKKETRVGIQITDKRHKAIPYDTIKFDGRLSGLSIFRNPQGTNFELRTDEAERLLELW